MDHAGLAFQDLLHECSGIQCHIVPAPRETGGSHSLTLAPSSLNLPDVPMRHAVQPQSSRAFLFATNDPRSCASCVDLRRGMHTHVYAPAPFMRCANPVQYGCAGATFCLGGPPVQPPTPNISPNMSPIAIPYASPPEPLPLPLNALGASDGFLIYCGLPRKDPPQSMMSV
jgi:hypothetical protein